MDRNFEKIKCTVCNSESYELLSRKGHLNVPLYVSICQNCGLVYLNPRWTKERYLHYYNNEYKKYQKEIDFTLQKNNKAVLAYKEIIGFIPKNLETALDIGAGYGDYIYEFVNKFPKAKFYAVEPSVKCQEILQKRKIRVLSSDMDSDWHKNLKNKVDLVIIRMALEHCLDPVLILKKINYVLSNRGIAYICVPNIMKPGIKGSLTKYCFRAMHTYYFSENTLLALAAKANLKPSKINTERHIWGIFQKGIFNYKYKPEYLKTKHSLKRFSRKYFFYFIYLDLKSKAKKKIPKFIINLLKNR